MSNKGIHKQGRHNRALSLVEEKLRCQLRLHEETVRQHQIAQEREKVLCDQVLHQAFFSEFMAAVEQQEAAEAAAGHTAHSQQQQHEQVQQPSLMSHVQQQQVPSSYVVRLLQRRDVLQQVQQVRQMTARDWLQYFSTLFPKVLFLLEMVERSNSTPAALAECTAAAAALAADAGGGSRDAGASPSTPLANNPNNSGSGGGGAAANNGGNLLSQMFGGAPPLGLCAAADYEQLQEVIDDVATLVMLAYVFNEVPMLEACTQSYCSGPQLRPGPTHWQLVAQRMQLTPLQELHMSICLAEYRRLNQSSRADGGSLIQRAAVPNLLVAGALQEGDGVDDVGDNAASLPPLSPQPAAAAPTPARTPSATVQRRSSRTRARSKQTAGGGEVPGIQVVQQLGQQQLGQEQVQHAAMCGKSFLQEAAGGQDQLRQQLHQYVQRRHIHLLSAATFFMNVCSTWQLAMLISASYPFLPSFTGVAAHCATRVQQRQQQQQAEEEAKEHAAKAAALAGDASRSVSPPPVPAAADGSGSGGSAMSSGRENSQQTFLQQMLAAHEQRRCEELELHRQVCWTELKAVPL